MAFFTSPTVPDSYYPSVVGSNRNGIQGTRANSALRQTEKQVIFHQDPVGWLFFSYENVDRLVALLSQSFSGITAAILIPFMERVYNTDSVPGQTALRSLTGEEIRAAVANLNTKLEHNASQELLRLDAGNQRYVNYVHNGKVGIEKHAVWSRNTKREVAPNPNINLLASQEGMVFAPAVETSRVVPQIPAQGSTTKYAEDPVSVLLKAAQARRPTLF